MDDGKIIGLALYGCWLCGVFLWVIATHEYPPVWYMTAPIWAIFAVLAMMGAIVKFLEFWADPRPWWVVLVEYWHEFWKPGT